MYLLYNEKPYVYLCHYMYAATPTPTPTLTPTPLPTPMPPPLVQGVTVTRTVQGSSPALSVSWSAVSGSGITYTVCYSTTSGTQSDPPSGANCDTSGIIGASTTLGSLSIGTTYYIWVRAVSSGGRGPYSDRRQERTYQGRRSRGNYLIHLARTVNICQSAPVNLPNRFIHHRTQWVAFTGIERFCTIIDNYNLKQFNHFRG